MRTITAILSVVTTLGCAEAKPAPEVEAPTQDAGEHDAASERADAMTDGGDATFGPEVCDAIDARPLVVSRFDADQRCFEPVRELPDLCIFSPFGGPSGTGAGGCVIGPDGDPYAVFMRWGEDFSAPLHHPGILELPSTATDDEVALCSALYQVLQDTDDALRTILVGGDPNGPYNVGPACED